MVEAVAALLGRHGVAVRAPSIEPLGEGDFYRAYRVDGDRVLRIPKHGEAAAALRRECCLLPRLAPALPLAVPRPELCSAGEGGDPAFAFHPWLPGPALTRERYLALPEPARERCAAAVGRFLAQLHAADLVFPRDCGVPEIDYSARYGALLERAGIQLRPRLSREDAGWVESLLTEFLTSCERAPVPRVLLHGDLSPDHVLYDEDAAEVTGIIDFGDAAIGDPAWDLVYLYEDYGVDFLRRALRAYPANHDPGRLVRMRRFLELDAVRWAVDCAGAGEEVGFAEAADYLRRLRGEAERPPEQELRG